MPLIPAFERLRQEGHCEFEVSLRYKVSPRPRNCIVKPCLKKPKKIKKKEKKP